MTMTHTLTNLELAQIAVNGLSEDRGSLSDGYHTFDELYDHRITLYIALCKEYNDNDKHDIWKSKKHSDGSKWPGWFILGIGTIKGSQVTYHIPVQRWDECSFIREIAQAPEWDGHTSADVLERINNL